MNNFKIMSGGQPGITRGALDIALSLNVSCGGWCSSRNLDSLKNGSDESFPLVGIEDNDDRESTRKNVFDSDASAILFFRVLEGCAEETLDDCVQQGKPYRLIDGDELQPGQAAKLLSDFIKDCGATSLNIIGPESVDNQRAYKYGQDVTRLLIESLRRKGGSKRSGSKRKRQTDASKANGAPRGSTGKVASSRRRNRKKSRGRHPESAGSSSNQQQGTGNNHPGGAEVIVQHRTSKADTRKLGSEN